RWDPVTDFNAELQVIAGSDFWVADHVGILVSMLFLAAGLVMIARTMSEGPTGAIAWMAAAILTIAVTITVADVAIEAIVVRPEASHWAGATSADRPIAELAAVVAARTDQALFVAGSIAFGLAGLLFGLALAGGTAYPHWLGYVALVAGAVAILTGLAEALTGLSPALTLGLFPLSLALLVVWVVGAGVVLWRRAGSGLGGA
ncbi:MAG: hypothetical protein M3O87_05335, partial [Candidatus Dormibacteraeota bacterium]|nr:hypothetical protein [Candidatus Dormibacteraeota bacterium]